MCQFAMPLLQGGLPRASRNPRQPTEQLFEPRSQQPQRGGMVARRPLLPAEVVGVGARIRSEYSASGSAVNSTRPFSVRLLFCWVTGTTPGQLDVHVVIQQCHEHGGLTGPCFTP